MSESPPGLLNLEAVERVAATRILERVRLESITGAKRQEEQRTGSRLCGDLG